jgi:hypothetical protein
MTSRKRGVWVDFHNTPKGSSLLSGLNLGAETVSTCFVMMNQPVVTNGKIGSVSATVDSVTVAPRIAQVRAALDQA